MPYTEVLAPPQPRDASREPVDEYEAVTADDEPELSVSAAVARYLSLKADATASDVLQRGVELLSLGPQTRALALKAFSRARAIEGAEAEALYWTAVAHAEDGEPDEAMRCLNESLRFAELAVALGMLYELQEEAGLQYEAASTLERLRQIVEIEPDELLESDE
jgi:tetratricopeptide (TPR) repeat protein